MVRLGLILLLYLNISSIAMAAVSWSNPGSTTGEYPYNPQYEKYKELIETPLRGKIVPENFTLVDDFDAFMKWHDENTTGKWPDDRGLIRYQIEQGVKIENCVDNAKTLVNTSATSAGVSETLKSDNYAFDYPKAQSRCQNVFSQRFIHNPVEGAKTYAKILTYWLDNDVLKNINKTAKSIAAKGSRRADFDYATRSRVADSMAHYALYHRLYGLDETQQKQIDAMFTNYVKTYDYYSAFKASGSHFARICNLGSGATVTPNGGNDHCGSVNLRVAVSATLYGLEFENQTVFDFGIRHLEITLATFDKNKAYTAQIYRGMLALGYARQIIAELDKLDYALEKAFGLDFVNMKTPHGVTPGEVYKELLTFAQEPERLSYYFKNNGYGADERGGDFKAIIKDIKQGKLSPQALWEAFNLEEYYVLGSVMAQTYYPSEFEHYLKSGNEAKRWLVDGSINVGFNNLVLRQATGMIPTISAKKPAPQGTNLANNTPLPSRQYIFNQINDLKKTNQNLERSKPTAALLAGMYDCKLDILRTLVSTEEKGLIGRGQINIQDGVARIGTIEWNTGIKVKWPELAPYADLYILKDGSMRGILPVLTMFGNDRIELFDLAGDNKASGDPDSPMGFFKIPGVEDVLLDLEIHDCR